MGVEQTDRPSEITTAEPPPFAQATDPAKSAAIEAAKARAAARKAARLAASGNTAEVSADEEKSPSPYGGRDGMGVEQTNRPSEITTPPFAQPADPAKLAAIEAAKARAAARKAARLANKDNPS